MHWACSNGSIDLVERLLQHGADVDAVDNDGVTPLMRASFGGHLRVVQLLLTRGADTSLRDRDGITALSGALDLGHGAVADLIEGFHNHACPH